MTAVHHTLQGFINGVALAELSEVGWYPDLTQVASLDLCSDYGLKIRHDFFLSEVCAFFPDNIQACLSEKCSFISDCRIRNGMIFERLS
jgi:hypothetical protein